MAPAGARATARAAGRADHPVALRFLTGHMHARVLFVVLQGIGTSNRFPSRVIPLVEQPPFPARRAARS